LLLCCLAGRTRDEAAEQLEWTLGAFKMRLERGRQLLRGRLARRGLTVSAALLAMMLAQHAAASPLPAAAAAATAQASLVFAAGKSCAALSSQAVKLASYGLSAGASKAKLLGAVALLLSIIGVAVGSLIAPRAPESATPATPATPSTLAVVSVAPRGAA